MGAEVVVVLAGVSGTGKSTVGRLLAGQLGWTFEDGDDLHPAANVAKMHAGLPLTDADREPWLRAVAAWIDARITAGEPGVIACSALKRRYRDRLREGRPAVRIAFLLAARGTLAARLSARRGHFFPARLLESQLSDCEPPVPGEPALVVPATDDPARVTARVIEGLRLGPATYRGSSRRSETGP